MNQWRDHKSSRKGGSRAAIAVLLLLWAGCGDGAQLVKGDEQGGIVVYPYRSKVGHTATKFRNEAIELIEQQCPRGYKIIREGEAKEWARLTPVAGSVEVVKERRWAMKFQCR